MVDFDLAINMRLRLHDLENEQRMIEASSLNALAGLTGGMVPGASAANDYEVW